MFGGVQCERRFSWLRLPQGDEASDIEVEIRVALIEHCRATQHVQPNPKKRQCSPEVLAAKLISPAQPRLEFDFYVPKLNTAFEFDERQHFTAERAVSLTCYDGRFQTGFDVSEWIKKCAEVRSVDADPIWRDWQRAYRDSVRDIRAAENNIRLVRYSYKCLPTPEDLLALLG